MHGRLRRGCLKVSYDPLLACRELIDIREQLLSVVPDEVMDLFVAVESEVDTLPIGPERAYGAEESLRVRDQQAANYRERVRGEVKKALRPHPISADCPRRSSP